MVKPPPSEFDPPYFRTRVSVKPPPPEFDRNLNRILSPNCRHASGVARFGRQSCHRKNIIFVTDLFRPTRLPSQYSSVISRYSAIDGASEVSETRVHTLNICEEKGFRENIDDTRTFSPFPELTSEKGIVVNKDSSS
ncbi:hypothetical protein L1987_00683 [Smallanthus sonchifolius]|uniref:Uncharacterized protein n=1 Tax=Smallanthus sonchifolius TaxID=185202 RepID=A0ACB9K2Y2_9ASTR|nr:hypothetical protein L1987_00683 [Smallanthus sonchifolius]